MNKRQEKRTIPRMIDGDFLQWIKKLSFVELASIASILVLLWLGSAGAYLLGVVLSLPWEITRLFNTNTIVHITGNLTFLIVVIYAFFKCTNVLVHAAAYFWTTLYCHLLLARKYPGGYKDPVVKRYALYRHKRTSLHQPEKRRMQITRVLLTLCFAFFATYGFSFGTVKASTGPGAIISFITGGCCGIAFYSVLQEEALVKHGEFKVKWTSVSRDLLVALVLVWVTLIGSVRTTILTSTGGLVFGEEPNHCLLSAFFPVMGGILYFDLDSKQYIVLNQQGDGLYLNQKPEHAAPACLSSEN